MLFVARSPYTNWTIRALLATTHIPLSQVADTLTPQLLSQKLDLLVECLEKDFGIENGIIAIAGLNPHSGEQGQLGREEIDWLIPWLEQERQNRPQLQLAGPIPPDTMWVKPGQAWYGNGQILIFPLFNIYIPISDNIKIGVLFTVVSLVRSYALRRLFNWFSK